MIAHVLYPTYVAEGQQVGGKWMTEAKIYLTLGSCGESHICAGGVLNLKSLITSTNQERAPCDGLDRFQTSTLSGNSNQDGKAQDAP